MTRARCTPLIPQKDVQNVAKLPAKTEQVLFCKLTEDQKREYKAFLNSQEVADVLDYKVHAFRAITILRKICNHPDLMHEVRLPWARKRMQYPNSSHFSLCLQVKQRLPNGTIYKGTNLTRPDDYGSWRKAGKLLVVDQVHRPASFSPFFPFLGADNSFECS